MFDRRRTRALLLALPAFVPWTARALDDPTAPPAGAAPVAKAAPDAPRALTAILTQHGERVAVIDGERVRVGERVGSDVVRRIGATGVELAGPEGPIELRLFGPSVKSPASIDDGGTR